MDGLDWWAGVDWWIGGVAEWKLAACGLEVCKSTLGLVDWWSGSLQFGAWRFGKSLLARATAMGRRIIVIILIIIITII